MLTFMKRVSRFENHIDTSIERFLFHHKFLGFIFIFIGIPLSPWRRFAYVQRRLF